MLEIEDSYYEDEVREGFFIPSIMKKAWAANLKVLSEVDRICEKYGIVYYASYGTLLGAVRHGGFIPWDDDLDIMMKRADYERFLQVADQELPEGYTILNAKNTDNFWYFLARVATGKHMRFEEEYLEEMHGFPYITGLDIFILDKLSSDEKEEEMRDKMINYILAVADNLEGEGRLQKEALESINQIEKMCGVVIDRNQTMYQMRKELYQIAIKMCSAFEDDEKGNLSRLMPDVLTHGSKGFPANFFDDVIYMPFENTVIPVPAMYDQLMEQCYGTYVKVVKEMAGHDYPFIEKQKAQFEAVWGQKFPEYQYPEQSELEFTRYPSYKKFVREYLDNLLELLNAPISLDTLYEAQKLAIELGGFIDEVRGENTHSVSDLEKLCEEIFNLYQLLEINGGVDESAESMILLQQLETVCEAVTNEIYEHEEVIFIPFHAKHWEMMERAFEKEMSRENCDVYVMPIPYYYKDYTGKIIKEIFEIEQYPKDLPVMDYQSYDWELRHPDRVYIQYPYDNWNHETIIPQEYFSSRLKFYTEELVYIPYFEVDDFDWNYEREYYNMKYYCNMPGVVNADKIILSSERLKAVYVRKLTEFAGEMTEEIWKQKIEVEHNMQSDKMPKKDDKTVMFYVCFSRLLKYKQKAINKILKVLEIFEMYRDSVKVLWVEDALVEINKDKIDGDIYTAYEKLVEKFKKLEMGTYIDGKQEFHEESIVKMCDAYYGDSSRLAYLCNRVGKPVMIKSEEVL